MKAYKGFNKDMTCRGFQFEEGKTYEEESAELCNKGFHACIAPIDVLKYYASATSVYHEVELDGVSDKRSDDSKVCGKVIKIGAKLDIAGLAKAQFEYVKSNCTNGNNSKKGKPATAGDRGAATAGDRGAATAGSYGAATAGYRGAATAGSYGAATAGDRGAATAGYIGAATAGYRGAATAGSFGAATAGSYGAATAGFRGAATAGDSGAATSKGASAVGKEGAALARGNGAKVKGGMGAVLVAVEENEIDCGIKSWCAGVVDGDELLPDVWYRCVDGKFERIEQGE